MFRISSRNAPHNLYADTELVRERIDERGFYFYNLVQNLFIRLDLIKIIGNQVQIKSQLNILTLLQLSGN